MSSAIIAIVLVALTFEAIVIAGLLGRIADALDAQNRHYGIGDAPAVTPAPTSEETS